MPMIQIFIYLQLLDLLTTLIGFKLGAQEASPFVCMLMHTGPAMGVALSKGLALGIGGLCVYANRPNIIKWVTYWYGVLAIWNLMVMLHLVGTVH
jgi:hypothetical protein